MPSHLSLRCAVSLTASAVLIAGGAAFVAAGPASAAAVTRYVATSGTDTDNDCTVKADPCLSIGHAVGQANAGDSISIGAGTYHESVTIFISLTLTGAGTSGASDTKVEGDGDGDNTFTVDEGKETSPTVTFDDLDISGNTSSGKDGVVTEDASHVTIENSAVSNNSGAGIDAEDDSAVTLTKAVVGDNADDGMDLDDDSSATVSSSSFSGNDDGIDAEGAGSRLAVTSTTISGNSEVGIENDPDIDQVRSAVQPAESAFNATVSGSVVSANREGGIENCDGTLSVDHSTISGNTGFGVRVDCQGSVTLSRSTSSGNIATNDVSEDNPFDGAGIFVDGGASVTVSESTLSGNQGQGLLVNEATATVANSTVSGTIRPAGEDGESGTSADIPYAGVVVDDVLPDVAHANRPAVQLAPAARTSSVTVTGTVVAQQGDSLPDCAGTIADGTYNVSSDHSCGFSTAKHDLINANAKLGALANNGGSTKTQLPGHGSAAIDVIPVGSAGCAGGTSDQRGVSRPQGPRCDVGAVEVAVPPIVVHPNSPLPKGTVGKAYREVLTATGGNGGPYTFTLAPGSSLPADLTLSSTGVISGVPQTAGTYTFTVSVNDPVLKKYTLVVDAAEATAPLAATGSDLVPLVGGGAGLVLSGGLFLFAAGLTRRRGAHPAA